MRRVQHLGASLVWLALGCATAKPAQSAPLRDEAVISEVILLGEAHGQQRTELRALLDQLKPDMVLMEFPMDLFQGPNRPAEISELRAALRDLPSWQYCQATGTACHAFDMQGRDFWNRFTRLQPRHRDLVNRFLGFLAKNRPEAFSALKRNIDAYVRCESAPLAVKNSDACDQAREANDTGLGAAMKEARARGDFVRWEDVDLIDTHEDEWNRRNAAMAQNICAFAHSSRARRIVVHVGADHRPPLKKLLATCPVTLRTNLSDVRP